MVAVHLHMKEIDQGRGKKKPDYLVTSIKRVVGILLKSLFLEALEIVTCHWVGGYLKRMSLFQNRLSGLYFTSSEDIGAKNFVTWSFVMPYFFLKPSLKC